MDRLLKYRPVALLLALWVALAPAYAVLPAAAMTMEMNVSGVSGTDCCDTCPSGEIDCNVCVVMCRIAAQVATTGDVARMPPRFIRSGEQSRPIKPLGQATPPDPAPPKSVPLA